MYTVAVSPVPTVCRPCADQTCYFIGTLASGAARRPCGLGATLPLKPSGATGRGDSPLTAKRPAATAPDVEQGAQRQVHTSP